MHRMTPAPLSTSARLPMVAPPVSKSASATEAASPAPCSTATSAPSATNFFTASGIAAQRASPAASFSTAIFMRSGGLFEDQENEECDHQASQRAPFQQLGEARVIANVRRDVLGRRAHEERFFFGHESSLRSGPRVHNKQRRPPQA